MNNNEKMIVISGGGRGLGLALTNELLKNGYKVSSFSRHTTKEVESLLKKYPKHFFWNDLDVTDYDGVNEYISSIIETHNNIYALINNAAIATDGVITLVPTDTIHKVIEINLASVLHLTQLCVNQMLMQNNSIILNISSIIGTRGYAGLSIYTATKAALDGVTRSLARELGPKNIRVNSVAPGYLETEMSKGLSFMQRDQIIRRTPLGRLGTVEDIASLVHFLLSDGAQFITGQTFIVDGGLNC